MLLDYAKTSIDGAQATLWSWSTRGCIEAVAGEFTAAITGRRARVLQQPWRTVMP